MQQRRFAKAKQSQIPFSQAKIARPRWSSNSEFAARVEHLLRVLNGISRTFKGESNTESSNLKVPLKFTGRALQRKVRFNFRRTAAELESCGTPILATLESSRRFILAVAASVNAGLQQEGVPHFRFWRTLVPHHPPPEDIPQVFDRFCTEFSRRLPEALCCPDTAIRMAAWIEQQLNGRDHPLSDGCGRTSRMLSFFILNRHGIFVPEFKVREDYFMKINQSDDEWHQYFRDAIPSKFSAAPQETHR